MSLSNAMAAFVATGSDRTVMDVPAWALTYNCEPDAIRVAYEEAMTAHSRQQHHNGEIME